MALQTSGEISILDIYNEFGGPSSGGYGLSDYYRGGAYVGNNNTNVPTSGEIALSDFYGASAGVEVQYSVTGGGGAGGYGVDNGSVANSFANAGGASSINHSSFTAISAAGGSGGQNGSSGQGTGSGGDGADSALGTNTGGAGGGRNSSGGAGNRGGGGGGGGGDAPSRYDRSGAAGSGGGAGATETGSLFLEPGITIDMVVGSGGLRSTTGYDGGSGGAGEITISQSSINPNTGASNGFNIIRTFGGANQREGQSGTQFIFNNPKAADLNAQFWAISEFVNRTNEADTNNPFSVSEIMNLYSGTGRLYIAHKNDYSSSTFYNDTPIACVQIINGLNNSVVQNWWFGDNTQSWETADGYISGTSTKGTAYTPSQAAGRTYYGIGSGYDSSRFMWASSTGSSRTGAQGGISNPGNTPMTVGEETMTMNAAEYFIFREVSGTNPRYSENHVRSPSRTWQVGEFVRIAYIVGNNSTGTYDADDILHIAVA